MESNGGVRTHGNQVRLTWDVGCEEAGTSVHACTAEKGSGDEHGGQPLVSISCNPDELGVRELHGRALAHHRGAWGGEDEEKNSHQHGDALEFVLPHHPRALPS